MSQQTELEERLVAALAARAEQVRPEDLHDLVLPATVVPLHRRRSTYAVLAAAACLVLVVTLTVLGRDPGLVEPAPDPDPDRPTVSLPSDVGRDWTVDDLSSVARLDLDGDGSRERVRFLGEPTEQFDGRTRLEATLSTSGEPTFGVVDLGSTIGIHPLGRIDADGDGDQELVLLRSDPDLPDATEPVVVDLRDGLLVEAPAAEPDLLTRGDQEVSAADDGAYRMVRMLDFWVEDGALWSMRSVEAFASGEMSLWRPGRYVNDAWRWRLADDGVLEPERQGQRCVDAVEAEAGERTPCEGESDALPEVGPVVDERVSGFGVTDGQGFEVSIVDGGAGPVTLEVEAGGRRQAVALDAGPQPRLVPAWLTGILLPGADQASVLVTSADGTRLQVAVQSGDDLLVVRPSGEVPLLDGTLDDGREVRTWVAGQTARTGVASLFTAVARTEDPSGPWDLWSWTMTSREEMTAVPRAQEVCFTDPADPVSLERC